MNSSSTVNQKRKRKSKNTNHSKNENKILRSGYMMDNHPKDLPEIHHLDPQLTPLFLQVIQSQKKCIQMEQNMIPLTSNSSSSSSAHHTTTSLWNRIQAQTEATKLKPLYDQQQEYKSHLEHFLQELSNCSSSSWNGTKHNNKDDNNKGHDRSTHTNAMACFHFIMDLLHCNDDHENATSVDTPPLNISLQHAVLRILPYILQQDRMLEKLFIRHLKRFVDVIGNASRGHSTTITDERNSKRYSRILHMQQDAVRMIQEMAVRYRYTTTDPNHYEQQREASKLIIAYRYLSEQKGISLLLQDTNTTITTDTICPQTNGQMIDVRKKRDQAIQYGEKECRKLNRVLQMVQECIDILVPRFGHEPLDIKRMDTKMDETSLVSNNNNGQYKDDDIDDEDIEWEDGDDNILNISHDTMSYDHVSSVEQTLAVMEQSGSLQHGAINIELDTQKFSAHVNDNEKYVSDDKAQEMKDKLMKYADVLRKRLQVLDGWYHALITADNMIESNRVKTGNETLSGAGGSLVLLPPLLREKKGKVLHLIHVTKSDVTQALSSIRRLKHSVDDGTSDELEDKSTVSDPKATDHSMIAREDTTSTQSWISGLNHSRPAETAKDNLELNWKTNQNSRRKPKSRVQIKLRRT
jgi:hypothetical protein